MKRNMNIFFFQFFSTALSFGLVIAQIPQDLIGLKLPPKCPRGWDTAKLPIPKFSIQTGDSISVSSSPPDIVTVDLGWRDQLLSLAWNIDGDVVEDSIEVTITFPADDLVGLVIENGAVVDVESGFTSLELLAVSRGYLTADFSTLKETNLLETSIAYDSNVTMKGSIYRLSVSEDSIVTIEGDIGINSGDVSVSSGSSINLKGDVIGRVSISDGANATVEGDTHEKVSVSSGSNLYLTGSTKGELSLAFGANFAYIGGEVSDTATLTSTSTISVTECTAAIELQDDGECFELDDPLPFDINITADLTTNYTGNEFACACTILSCGLKAGYFSAQLNFVFGRIFRVVQDICL